MYAKTIRSAFISSMPVLMGYLTMGMAFGILLVTQVPGANGFTAAVMSIFTISGSMQFAAVDMQTHILEHHLMIKRNAQLIDLNATKLAGSIRPGKRMHAMHMLRRRFLRVLRCILAFAQRFDLLHHLDIDLIHLSC